MNQLVPAQNDLQILQTIARTASSSGLYSGAGNEQKILMILLAAQELGIKPMTALNGGIWNIQGKIEISARLMNSMIRKAGHSITVKELNNQKCILEGKRSDNGDTCTAQFTIEEAQKCGLCTRDVWKKYTEDMLYARAMSRLARRLFSDIISTAYVEGEIRDAGIIEVSPEVRKNNEMVKSTPQINDSMDKIQVSPPSNTNNDHIVHINDMIDNSPKMITETQWNELKLLIDNCSETLQNNIWDYISSEEISSHEEMDFKTYEKLRKRCLVELELKQKAVQ